MSRLDGVVDLSAGVLPNGTQLRTGDGGSCAQVAGGPLDTARGKGASARSARLEESGRFTGESSVVVGGRQHGT